MSAEVAAAAALLRNQEAQRIVRHECLYEFSAVMNLHALRGGQFWRTHHLIIHSVPVDICLSTRDVPGFLSFGIRVGVAFLAGTTSIEAAWTTQIAPSAISVAAQVPLSSAAAAAAAAAASGTEGSVKPQSVDFEKIVSEAGQEHCVASHVFKQTPVRQSAAVAGVSDAASNDKWSPMFRVQHAVDLARIPDTHINTSGEIRFEFTLTQFQPSPSLEILTRIMFDMMTRTADKNRLLDHATRFQDLLAVLSQMKKKNAALAAQVDASKVDVAQANRSTDVFRQKAADLERDIASVKKRRKLKHGASSIEAGVAAVVDAASEPDSMGNEACVQDEEVIKCSSILHVAPLLDRLLEEGCFDDMKTQDLARLHASTTTFQSALSKQLTKPKDCYICCMPIAQRVCATPCGHTNACGDCLTQSMARDPRCPLCRAAITGFVPMIDG
jgi:hypothetical protein